MLMECETRMRRHVDSLVAILIFKCLKDELLTASASTLGRGSSTTLTTTTSAELDDSPTEGKLCSSSQFGAGPNGTFYCPTTSHPPEFDHCCGPVGDQHCCADTDDNDTTKWGIGISIVIVSLLIVAISICLFNKYSYICFRRGQTSPPRPKLRLNTGKTSVHPVDKRTLLKTANYTVEQSWDQIIVKFNNNDFHSSFKDAMLRRYRDLEWKNHKTEAEADVITSSGNVVNVRMITDSRVLIISKPGSFGWVMNDFQNICKNLVIADGTGRRSNAAHTLHRALQPRLPTIGEEFYDAGEYHVKTSQTEIEIKFMNETQFDNFKRVLLYRYPTIPWSKYLQRDCAQIKLDSGKTVTLHLWEDIRSVWLSGDGKKDWYMSTFQDLYSDATKGKLPETILLPKSRPESASSKTGRRVSMTSIPSLSRSVSYNLKDIPANYTVKTLEIGGYEIEFPTTEFLDKLKELLDKTHPGLQWREYSCRHVTKLTLNRNKSVSIHVGNTHAQMKKLWIYDEPGCKEWFNGEFQQLYACAYEAVYCVEHLIQREGESPIAPVESSL